MAIRANPFAKWLKCETLLHVQCVSYLNSRQGSLAYHHSPNEGRRSPFERYIVSLTGVSKGYPDIMVYWHNNKVSPLAIELKWDKNTPSPEQEVWLKRLGGWACWSLDAFIKIIEGHEKLSLSDWVYLNEQYCVLLSDDLPVKIKKLITKQCGEEVWNRK